MNKAFVKSSLDADDDEPQLPALPAGGKNYITPAGYARIKNELLDLIDKRAPQGGRDRALGGQQWRPFRKRRLPVWQKTPGQIDRRIRFLTKVV